MVSLTQSKAVLELGKRLVAQLDTNDDLLASWMSHDIAQRIDAAEKAPAEAKGLAHEACAKAILELWRYRNALPDHLRPLGEIEPVLRTLASLDVDQTDYRFYPQVLREAATTNADEDAKQWLEFAIGLDYTARLLIRFALSSAAHRAAAKAEPWIEIARQAGADEGVEGTVVKFVVSGDEAGEADKGKQHAALRDKLSRMESFANLAASLAKELRAQLGSDDLEKE
ncbi:AVAST type 3 anti-phage proein Avs3b [Rhodocyclus tenuis]|uniref:AVAST type 3 anti-phage proein Avs3b n=1 Tax=Rhodocyclus tenuis TaxID=1066 RepID=UPI0019036ADE|nr:AVAST type 3 anti-phage proein Avs3b [Rhodocyclus tenuis]